MIEIVAILKIYSLTPQLSLNSLRNKNEIDINKSLLECEDELRESLLVSDNFIGNVSFLLVGKRETELTSSAITDLFRLDFSILIFLLNLRNLDLTDE